MKFSVAELTRTCRVSRQSAEEDREVVGSSESEALAPTL